MHRSVRREILAGGDNYRQSDGRRCGTGWSGTTKMICECHAHCFFFVSIGKVVAGVVNILFVLLFFLFSPSVYVTLCAQSLRLLACTRKAISLPSTHTNRCIYTWHTCTRVSKLRRDVGDDEFRSVSQLSLIMTLLLWMRNESNTR